ncbi:hypothetical protein ACVWZ4_002092 [Bradyrhizobium sp. USDA 4472]
MSADKLSRRAFAGGIAALAFARRASAQGYAGLGETADGFAIVTPGKTFTFPGDHGAASGLSHRVVVSDGEPG